MKPLLSWAVLFALYLLFAGQASSAELVAGALLGALAAAYEVHVRRLARCKLRLTAPWSRLTVRTLGALARDTGLVGWGLIRAIAGRPLQGGEARQPFETGDLSPGAAGGAAAGHRAIAVLAVSIAPNTYVIDVLEPPQGLLVHRLVARTPAADRQWPV